MNGDLSFSLGTSLAFAKDETKPWLSPSAKQRQNPCSGSPAKAKWGLGNTRELQTSEKRGMLGTNERFFKYPSKVIASDWVRGRVSSCVSGFEYAP